MICEIRLLPSPAGLRLLRKKVDAEGENWINLLQGSVTRMSGMIDNVMDFARARLGGGMQLRLKDDALAPLIEQIVAEFENSEPGSRHRDGCQRARQGQNRCRPDGAVVVESARQCVFLWRSRRSRSGCVAQSTGSGFAISVSNRGAPIPAEAMPHLFTAFQRGDVQPNQQGLGLGLYIAQEIARAHGGIISVQSNPDQTTFTAAFPLTG